MQLISVLRSTFILNFFIWANINRFPHKSLFRGQNQKMGLLESFSPLEYSEISIVIWNIPVKYYYNNI